jgi:hypothetical protein
MTAPNNLLSGATMTDSDIAMTELERLIREYGYRCYESESSDTMNAALDDVLSYARPLLSASKPAAPEGWKLVPLELTDEMGGAFFNAELGGRPFESHQDAEWYGNRKQLQESYAAMLAAAPAAPSAEAAAQSADAQDKRGAFEAWMQTGEIDPTPNLSRDGDFYDDADAEHAWRIFQVVAALFAKPDAASGEPIYQVTFSDDDGWLDTHAHVYNNHPEHARRIVYTAAQPAQTPQVASQGDERQYDVENALTDALAELIDKIKPGLDCGNIIEDAKEASEVLDESNELYAMRMAAISTAAMGCWKEGDSIHPDYDTVALRDVAKLYAKYADLQARAASPRVTATNDDRVLIRELQKALFYWMPSIAGPDSPAGIKAAEHSYLLFGLDDNSTECWGDQILQYVGTLNREQERLGIVLSDAGCSEDDDYLGFIENLAARVGPDAKAKAAEFMIAARNASMFQEVRELVSTLTDPQASCPNRHVEARRILPLLDSFLGEGYTGRALALKRLLADLNDSGECESCIDGKCVTGNRCVSLGWDAYTCGRCKDTGHLPDGNHCQWCAQDAAPREALTDEQREAIEYGADCIHEKWGETMKAEVTLRALLTAAQPESGAEK